jgi:hypothetical protein
MALQPTFLMPTQESPPSPDDPRHGDSAAPGETYPAEVAPISTAQVLPDLPVHERTPAPVATAAPAAQTGTVEFTLTVLRVQVAVDPGSRRSETVCTVMLPNGAVVALVPHTPEDSSALEMAMMQHLATAPASALPNRRPAVSAGPVVAPQPSNLDNAAAAIGASVDRLTQMVTDLMTRNATQQLLPQAAAVPPQVPSMVPQMPLAQYDVPVWARPPALPPMQPPMQPAVNQAPSPPLKVPPPVLRPPPSEKGKPTHGPNVSVPWSVIEAAVPGVFGEAPARGGPAAGQRPGTAGRGTPQR